jgi:hypothetical protein
MVLNKANSSRLKASQEAAQPRKVMNYAASYKLENGGKDS